MDEKYHIGIPTAENKYIIITIIIIIIITMYNIMFKLIQIYVLNV